ncbi:MAG: hypothetical protein H7210_03140 [Pyrinomonadaceae bacterium]|nr:hypothetical protein [Phycisphaerales bacterium]
MASPRCVRCGYPVDETWERCPECGYEVLRSLQLLARADCREFIRPYWACGAADYLRSSRNWFWNLMVTWLLFAAVAILMGSIGVNQTVFLVVTTTLLVLFPVFILMMLVRSVQGALRLWEGSNDALYRSVAIAILFYWIMAAVASTQVLYGGSVLYQPLYIACLIVGRVAFVQMVMRPKHLPKLSKALLLLVMCYPAYVLYRMWGSTTGFHIAIAADMAIIGDIAIRYLSNATKDMECETRVASGQPLDGMSIDKSSSTR